MIEDDVAQLSKQVRQLPAVVGGLLAQRIGQQQARERRQAKKAQLAQRLAAARLRRAARGQLIPHPVIDPVKVATTKQRLHGVTINTPAAIAPAAKLTDRNPTDAQRAAGNYRKGKFWLHGLNIAIENPRGSVRKAGQQRLAHHYGYIKRGPVGADGDAVDVFIGPHPHCDQVFIVDQCKLDGSFDEHKVLLGFRNQREARQGYLANYPTGWKMGPLTAMTMQQFKEWLTNGDTGDPISG